jgi:hypothetical protein
MLIFLKNYYFFSFYYCHCLDIPSSQATPRQDELDQLPPPLGQASLPLPPDTFKYLRQLVRTANRLSSVMGKALMANAMGLTVASEELAKFQEILSGIGSALKYHAPTSARLLVPDLPEVVRESLLDLLLRRESRVVLDAGHNQLVSMKQDLQKCIDRARKVLRQI